MLAWSLVGLAAILVLLYLLFRVQRIQSAWEKTARALRLEIQYLRASTTPFPILNGTVDNVHVTLDTYARRAGLKRSVQMRIVTRPEPGVACSIEPRPENAFYSETLTGDQAFDSKIRASGSERELLAALDARSRETIRQLVGQGISLREGRLEFRSDQVIGDARKLESLVRNMISTARMLSPERASVPQRLLENVQSDPDPGARHRSLEVLVLRHAETGAAGQAVRTALRDTAPRVRLLAAAHAGDEGLEIIRQVSDSSSVPDPLRAEALGHLVRAFPQHSLSSLEQGLSARSKEVRHAAIQGVGHLKHAFAVQKLANLLDPDAPDTALLVIRAIREIGSPLSEPALVGVLNWSDEEVRLAAIEALGTVGGMSSIDLLRGLARSTRVSKTKDAAEEAIKNIEFRHIGPGLQPG